jgi:hypothetical protein
MGHVKLPYVEGRKDRNGRVAYWYFVRRGGVWRLPGEPGSDEFHAKYQRLLAETAPRAPDSAAGGQTPAGGYAYTRGTFGALVTDFLASSDFKTKSERTRGEYERIALLLQAEHGNKRLAHLKRRHIRQIRDAKAETPGAANNVLRLLKRLLNFAVDDELIESSPAAKMKELPVGEWRAWTDEECAAFERRWAPGTMQRRAYAVALYTGQRKRDQISRTRAHRRDGGICVVQSKTDEELWIPEHRELTAELARQAEDHRAVRILDLRGRATEGNVRSWHNPDVFGTAAITSDFWGICHLVRCRGARSKLCARHLALELVHRACAEPGQAGRLADTSPLREFGARRLDLVGQRARPAEAGPNLVRLADEPAVPLDRALGAGKPGAHPCHNHLALELGEHAEHAEHGPACRRGGVDGLGVDVEPGPGVADGLEHLDQM